jgi:uncharacterized protein with HEPN domain
MSRDDATLLDIFLAAEDILSYTRGMDIAAFRGSRLVQDAVLYRIGVLGEAVKLLSPEFRDGHPEIPWKSIAGMRDWVIHVYNQVNLTEVWDVVENGIPALWRFVKPLIPPKKD